MFLFQVKYRWPVHLSENLLNFVPFGENETLHDRRFCALLVSAGLWLPNAFGICWNFTGAKVVQQHMLYSQTHLQCLQKIGALWKPDLGCFLLPWLGEAQGP